MAIAKLSKRRKILLAVAGVFALLAVTLAVISAFRPKFPIHSTDPRLQILSVKLLRNPSDTYYVGFPGEGQVRSFLWKIGVRWVAPPDDRSRRYFMEQRQQKRQGDPILVVRFCWDDPAGEPGGGCPRLYDDSGKRIPDIGYFNPLGEFANDPCLGIWFIPPGATNSKSFQLRPK